MPPKVARLMRPSALWSNANLNRTTATQSIRLYRTTTVSLKQLAERPDPSKSSHVLQEHFISSPATPAQVPENSSFIRHNSPVLNAQISDGDVLIVFKASTQNVEQHRFPSFWLRDHCQCSICSHPQTKQRQLDTYSIPSDLHVMAMNMSIEGLSVAWSGPDNHKSLYPWPWLQAHSPFAESISSRLHSSEFTFPDQVTQSPRLPHGSYPSVGFHAITTTSSGLLSYLQQIHIYGLCFAPETSPTTEATEALLNRISFIRPTHYGAFWEFTSIANPTDTAYTTLPLPAHTDTTYFTDPCGLQMFHCLSHTDGDGGESMFVDGFAVADYLYQVDPQGYKILSEVPIVSHASGDQKAGVIMNTGANRGYPVLNHDISSSHRPRNLTQIRWNNDDRSPLTRFDSPAQMKAWYNAARGWSALLRDPQFEIQVKLKPGNPVIFDNWRVLHGRRAFTGKRRMCGGYIGMDDFLGRLRGLENEVGGQAQSQL